MKLFQAASFLALGTALLIGTAAHAEGLTYFEDPVYEKLAPADHHPMDDMILYAQAGDTRAQFILGDMYAKGKGGFAKNEKKAREWFEMAARNGEHYSFIRLAALAKHHKNWTEAYQWYSLAASRMPRSSDDRKWAAAQMEMIKKDGKASSKDIRAAEDAADDWVEKSKELLKADLELQKLKEPEAEALAIQDKLMPEEAPPADAQKDPKKDVKKDVKKEKPAAAPAKPAAVNN